VSAAGRPGDLRERMRAARVVGFFLKLPSTAVLDLARERFDFVIVDREHSPLDERQALDLLRHAAAIGLPAVLRLPTLDKGAVNRALEAGAAGIQLSMVTAPGEVEELRSVCEYAPEGTRSIALGHRGGDCGGADFQEYVAANRGRPLVVVQLETAEEPDAYRRIVAARPDVAFVGMADLRVDSGFDAARLAANVAAIRAACVGEGVVFGGVELAEDPAARYLAVSNDISMLKAGMAAARESVADAESRATDERSEP
jgi:4-hydroxy-2-oxoheptanedioate aldolase